MINKNSSSCNRAISFESLFTYIIGVRSLLAKAKFSKRSGADVFTLLSVLVTSIFKGYLNISYYGRSIVNCIVFKRIAHCCLLLKLFSEYYVCRLANQ